MPKHPPEIAQNLRFLCASRPSVSAICREIGLNRQQFERYLTGSALPSAHNLRRIAVYFSVTESDLLGDPAALQLKYAGAAAPDGHRHLGEALLPSPQELVLLRRYLGRYHYYFLTPSWPGEVQCGLFVLWEHDHAIRSSYLGRVRDPHFGKVIRSRFEGHVALRGERIFILEYARGVVDSFGQTILYAVHQHQANYLTGMTFGIGWHPHRGPFASHVIVKRLRESIPLREAMGACGLYPRDSRGLDLIVRNFFDDQPRPFIMGE